MVILFYRLEMKNKAAHWDCIQEHQSFRGNLAQSREKFIKQWMEDDLSKTVSNNSKQIKQTIESDKGMIDLCYTIFNSLVGVQLGMNWINFGRNMMFIKSDQT